MKAFPVTKDILSPDFAGMDLKDYFAAKAMQQLILSVTDNGRFLAQADLEKAAHISYSAADAMMKARAMSKARDL